MKQVYLILAALMLLCLAPMPYGYYMLVRFLSALAFGVMAYRYYQERKETLAYICGMVALLFQPFYKIALGRTVWNIVDVVVAIGLIILFFGERRGHKNMPDRQNLGETDNSINIERFEDNIFEFQLEGKLSPQELLYVASEEDKTLTDLFETKPEVFEGWGQMMGFHIVYLPMLMKRLRDKNVLRYRAPYLTDMQLTHSAIGNDFLLQYLERPSDKRRIKQGFIRTEDIHRDSNGKDKALNRFYPLSSNSTESLADQLHRISKQIATEQSSQRLITERKSERDSVYSNADNQFNSQIGEENTDDLIEEVRERIAKLRQRGISQYILEQLIHPDDRLSRLIITKNLHLFLPDYNNMEIKMEPLVKAVYLLFLNHPEGIMFKNLPDYRKELTQIYVRLKPYGLGDKALQSIEDVTNPLLNSINEKCARIRGAFLGQFDNHMARHYYIDGLRGEAKKIALPRSLITWE